MGDDGVKVAIGVEDDTVGTGAAASVDLEAVQDGELVPGARGREAEALVVVVLVGVGVWKATCQHTAQPAIALSRDQ